MSKIFGTDGIRTEFGKFPLDVLSLNFLTIAVHSVLYGKERGIVLIASDNRISRFSIINMITSTLQFLGVKVLNIGIITTPCLAFLTNKMDVDYSIMVTASHNDYKYNGIKIFDNHGYKISDEKETQIESAFYHLLKNKKILDKFPISTDMLQKGDDVSCEIKLYKDYVINSFAEKIKLSDNFSVDLDCANGSISSLIRDIIDPFIKNVRYLNNDNDGLKINQNCGALFPKIVSNSINKHSSSLGVAFDGDGDRIVVCTREGGIVTGDQLIASIAVFHKEKYGLSDAIVSVVSSSNLSDYLYSKGINCVCVDVGDKNITRAMMEHNIKIGGERSGHIILPESINKSADAIIVFMKILEMYSFYGEKFIDMMTKFKESVRIEYDYYHDVSDIDSMISSDEFTLLCRNMENDLGQTGRVFIRKSGTENNLIRIIIESDKFDNIALLDPYLGRIIEFFQS
ncbi:hypothetical protein GUI12_01605 [Anaplasmataceae bacterium AB001_6]|nr:hypothetical protein GUI12_01605 [Anaplasmataceae bacterium AB001_6]